MNDFKWASQEMSEYFYQQVLDFEVAEAIARTIERGRQLRASYLALAVKNPSMAEQVRKVETDTQNLRALI